MLKNIGQTGLAVVLLVTGILAYQQPGAAAAAMPGTQCVVLPAPAAPSSSASDSASDSASASASASSADSVLCVSVQPGQSSVVRGQAAKFIVLVWMQNGAAPDVKVALSASPDGLAGVFSGLCPSGDGSGTCDLGPLGTAPTPATFDLAAAVTVPASDSSVTAVTLSVTAKPQTDPPIAVNEATTMDVVAPPPSPKPSGKPSGKPKPSSSPKPSSAPKPSSDPGVSVPPLPGTGASGLPVLTISTFPGPSDVTPGSGGAISVVSPGNASNLFPLVTPDPAPSPAVAPLPSADDLSPAGLTAPSTSRTATTNSALPFGVRATAAAVATYTVLAAGALLVATRIPGRKRRKNSVRRKKSVRRNDAVRRKDSRRGKRAKTAHVTAIRINEPATASPETVSQGEETLQLPPPMRKDVPPPEPLPPGHYLG